MIPFSSSIGEQDEPPPSSFVVAGPFADRTGLLAAGRRLFHCRQVRSSKNCGRL